MASQLETIQTSRPRTRSTTPSARGTPKRRSPSPAPTDVGRGGPRSGGAQRLLRRGRQSRSWGSLLYADAERAALPDAAVLASLGCGNPIAVAELREGETVLDLGSGGGIDVLLSARRVGPTGRAIGVDMTDEMLELARRNAVEAGATNVEFRKGTIEALPLETRLGRRRHQQLRHQPRGRQGRRLRRDRPGPPRGRADGRERRRRRRQPLPRRAGRARQLRRLHRRRALVRRVPCRPRGRGLDGRRGRADAQLPGTGSTRRSSGPRKPAGWAGVDTARLAAALPSPTATRELAMLDAAGCCGGGGCC